MFVCFVLEHLPSPERALARLGRVLKPGGTITVVEGDHGSTYFHPDSAAAREAIACQVELQARDAASQVIGTVTATLPTNGSPTPIRTPLQVTLGAPTITQVRVQVFGGFNGGLAVDDVTFTTGAGPLAACQ